MTSDGEPSERAGLRGDEQIALMKKVSSALAEHGALINEVLRVAEDETLSFESSSGCDR